MPPRGCSPRPGRRRPGASRPPAPAVRARSGRLDLDQDRPHRRITRALFNVRDAGPVGLEHPGLGVTSRPGHSLGDDPIALREGDADQVIAMRVKGILLLQPRYVPDGDRVVFQDFVVPGLGNGGGSSAACASRTVSSDSTVSNPIWSSYVPPFLPFDHSRLQQAIAQCTAVAPGDRPIPLRLT